MTDRDTVLKSDGQIRKVIEIDRERDRKRQRPK